MRSYRVITHTADIRLKVEGDALKELFASALDEDIKAVTYHEAQVRKNSKGNYETTIVFDV